MSICLGREILTRPCRFYTSRYSRILLTALHSAATFHVIVQMTMTMLTTMTIMTTRPQAANTEAWHNIPYVINCAVRKSQSLKSRFC